MGTQQVSRDAHVLHYWVEENGEGQFGIFYLKPNGEPTSIVVETVEAEEFQQRFKDCSTHKCDFKKKSEEEKKAEKKAEKANKKIKLGEKHLKDEEFNAASFEFGNALKEDEKNLKANFGKGKAHIGLGETDKAKEHFDKMAENEELYGNEHKHLFNELGIELRKNGMFKEAVRNYSKAIEIDADDEALYYNVARAYKDWGNKEEATKNIRKALELKPDFKEAMALLKNIPA